MRNFRGILTFAVLGCVLLLVLAGTASAYLVVGKLNLAYGGGQATCGWFTTLSDDARYMSFHSWGSDFLASGNPPGGYNCYVRDIRLGQNYLVNTPPGGGFSNAEATQPALSGNGQTVGFTSAATNLVPGVTNGVLQVYCRDWATGPVECASVSSTGVPGNAPSAHFGGLSICGPGRCIIFDSEASNLIPGGNPHMGIYARDRVKQTTECLSVNTAGQLADADSFSPFVSESGRYVAFISWASNLAPGGGGGVFFRDRTNKTTELISVNNAGVPGNGYCNGSRPAITPDGRYVVFTSAASNLVPNDNNGNWDVFLRDRVAGTTERISVSSAGGDAWGNSGADSYRLAISDDGRYVIYASLASNIVPGDTNGTWDAYVRDRVLGTNTRASIMVNGTQPDNLAGYYSVDMSADGLFRSWDTHAHNLVPGDTAWCIDTYGDYDSSYINASAPVAAFTPNPGYDGAPVTVSFTDTSTGSPTSWSWAFGDGGTSNLRNPTHTYTGGGLFAPTLTVSNAFGSSSTPRNILLNGAATPVAPVSSFNAAPTSGNAPLPVSFTDTSTGTPTSWSWSFGDGGSSAVESPSHTYTSSGTFTVSLYVSNSVGSNSSQKSITVNGAPSPVAPTANFSGSPLTGAAPLGVSFTDASSGAPTSWTWSFGDGGSSNQQSPSHTYNTAGSYSVSLTAANAQGGNTNQKANYISVTAPAAGHTVTATVACNPTSVSPGGTTACTATGVDSLGHTGLAWSWSDGGAGGTFSPSAAGQNPNYTAPSGSAGQTITLTVSVIDMWQYPWVTGTASAPLTVNGSAPASHTVTVSLTLPVSSVASMGSVLPTATASDSLSNAITAWSWSDGGAGGSFSPSATVQSPTYMAPTNTSGLTGTLTISVTAQTADGTHGTASKQLQVTSASSGMTATAAALPTTVASGGSVALTGTGVCGEGHTGFAWSWSDNGAGGTFVPSANSQNPTYHAPLNTTGHDIIVTLTISAICEWQWPWEIGTASVAVTVASGTVSTHTVTASITVPSSVSSGAPFNPTASAIDSIGSAITSWSWSDSGAGGTFMPSALTATPTYYAPVNISGSGSPFPVTITVTAYTADGTHGSASGQFLVNSSVHHVVINASALPTTIASGGSTALSASATCNLGHTGLAWGWSDNGAGGTFVPSANVPNPTYVAAANTTGSTRTITLTALSICEWFWPWTASSASATVMEAP